MIKNLSIKDLDSLDSLILNYFQYTNRPSFPLKERLAEGIKKETIVVFGKYLNNEAIGISVVNLNSVGINLFLDNKLIEEKKLINVESELFNAAFSLMKKNYKSIKYMGPVSETLLKFFEDNNFQSFNRKRMSIDSTIIKALENPFCPKGYRFKDYSTDLRNTLAEIMADSHFNENHPDGLIWGNWNGINGCLDLLSGIENSVYGKFELSDNKIIMKENFPIGVCFVTTLANDIGYIPEIVISRTEKQKGLGKILLIYSLKEFINKHDSSPRVDLDVTIDNNYASKLYSSIGFKEVTPYIVYVWNGDKK